MESLSEKNYEIWFLDYLDGRLGEAEVNRLLDFLKHHPQLKDELRDLGGFTLDPGTDEYPGKEDLMAGSSDIPGIARDDRFCIARMESDLTPSEAEAFNRRLEREPGLDKRYNGFLLTRLTPEPIAYPDKKELRHKNRVLAPWIITAVSAAALFILALILWPRPDSNRGDVAVNRTVPAETRTKEILVPEKTGTEPHVQILSAAVPKGVSAQHEVSSGSTDTLTRDFTPMNALSPYLREYEIRIPDPTKSPVLFAMVIPDTETSTGPDDEYLSLSQVVLKLFREKILGEDPERVRETRFSIWEVAGAGIDRINTLTGSEMKLAREYDNNGQVMAISFNSRLFDVATPVRMPENKQD